MTNVVSMFLERAAAEVDQPGLRVKRGDEFVPVTWAQFAADVRRTAAALASLDVADGERVVLVSENRYEWIVCDLAILGLGAVNVPVHATLAGPQVAFQANDCEPSLIVVSGEEQAAKLVGQSLPPGVPVLSIDACSTMLEGGPIGQLAEVAAAADETAVDLEAAREFDADRLATILYTSGTTGEPKGVMLSHGNLASNALATLQVFQQEPGDVRLSWLPLSHVFARTCDLYLWLASPGTELAVGEGRDTVIADCAAIAPTLINGVPYFYDKISRFVKEQTDDPPITIQQVLGGRVRLCCSGGAALPDHVAEHFASQDVPLVQGYGLTETSPVISVNTDHERIGTIGPPAPGIEVRFADDGELLTRGPHVMLGYWKRPEATAEVMEDGWFHTGDLGRADEDGYLYITGRKKELIVTAGGKNVAPVALESLLTEDPLMMQAMVVGEGRNYLAALIVPEMEQLKAEAERQGIEAEDAGLRDHPAVQELFAERIAQRLRPLGQYEQVGRFALLAEPFSVESGELTPTLKLRRSVIAKRRAEQIEALYR